MAIESELDALNKTAAPKSKAPDQPKRRALPPELPRVEVYREPEDLQCDCGCALQPLVDALREEVLQKHVLHADQRQMLQEEKAQRP